MKKLIGDKTFYKRVMMIAIPIMLQQGITQFLSLLDNIMIGNYSDVAMAGVSIVNQLLFIFNMVTIGAVGAVGIYLTQYFGAKNQKGITESFRLKIYVGLFICILAFLVLILFEDALINAFLTNPSTEKEKQEIISYAKNYLAIIIFTIPAFIISQVYSSSMRETGETVKPLIAGSIAVGVNFIFNFWLIFGGLGIPALGAIGAAIATLIARIVEMVLLLIFAYKKKYAFAKDTFKSLKVPTKLVNSVIIKGAPLIINEFLFSVGMTVLLKIYSERGTDVLKAFSISNTTSNLFYITFGAMATAISIMVGQSLGAGKLDEAVDNDYKLVAFSVFVCFCFGVILAIISPFIPLLYKGLTPEVRHLATSFMLTIAICMVIFAFNAACFFTLRAGGITFITLLFDSLFIWIVSIPVALLLVNKTALSIIAIYFITQIIDLAKSFFGFGLIKSKIWVRNLAQK